MENYQQIELYLMFKICLLLEQMSIKDFADAKTGTSPQHVTMVAKGEKDSVPVVTEIHNFIDSVLSDHDKQIFLKQMVQHGRAINNGESVKRGSKSNGADGEYDW